MTAIVLPDVDRATIDEYMKRMPNLKEIELPKMETVGRNADLVIDRLLGKPQTPVWPWVAAGLGLVAIVGVIAAYFAWFRSPMWRTKVEGRANGEPVTPFDPTVDAAAGDEMLPPETRHPIDPSLATPFEDA